MLGKELDTEKLTRIKRFWKKKEKKEKLLCKYVANNHLVIFTNFKC